MALTGIDHDKSPALEDGFTHVDPAQTGDGPLTSTAEADNQGRANDAYEDREWLQLARDAYQTSETWFDTSLRRRFEDDYAHFNSRHPNGSKYHNEFYRQKSKTFRPKTRSAIRRMEAAAAVAFFSTQDIVNASPVNPNDPDQVDAADLHKELLNYRLRESIPWFKICMGGVQDACTVGVVISKQTWRYERRVQKFDVVYERQDGTQEIVLGEEREKVVEDAPEVQILPVENVRFSPAANWLNPIKTSPYVIEMIPMYVHEIKRRMRVNHPMTGRFEFRPLEDNLLAAAIQQDWDSIRKAREEERIDRYENDGNISDFQTVWVHQNIMQREDGRDYIWFTLGTELMLSDPVPLEMYYKHGIRPYAMGEMIIETHKQYPGGIAKLLSPMQREVNDVANLRLDNSKLALNKRYLVRRGAGVDVRRLVMNVAGGAIMTSNTTEDIKVLEHRDVTASSYQEQDRLNLEMDELSGTFSQNTVGSSRQLNETVGGMGMLSADANELKEYGIRTVSETWVEEVMRQLQQLEAAYESDEVAIRVAAGAAGLDPLRALRVIDSSLSISVDVGFGATNPVRRVEKIALGLGTIAKFFPQTLQGADDREVVKEVFGALGWRDGSRFFPVPEGEEAGLVAKLRQENQQLRQIIEGEQVKEQAKTQRDLQVADIRGKYAVAVAQVKQYTDMVLAQYQGNQAQAVEAMKARLAEYDRMIQFGKQDLDKQSLFLQREALSHQIQEADRRFQLDLEQKRGEAMLGPVPEDSRAMDLPGNDAGGVIARDQYDLVPGNVM